MGIGFRVISMYVYPAAGLTHSTIQDVKFHNKILNKNDTFDIDAVILKETPIDIIIRRNTIE